MRQPVVANRFYPGSPQELTTQISSYFEVAKAKQTRSYRDQQVIGAMAPHAGYIYSGKLAAETLSSITIPETVLLLGPNHTGQGGPVSLSTQSWQMALGNVSIDQTFSDKLLTTCSLIQEDNLAHQLEHSLEVLVPFLQILQPNLSIVPILLSSITYQDCELLGQAIGKTIRQYEKDVLILASTDMSHYESRSNASKKDKKVLAALENLNPKSLYTTVFENNISMCGVIPVTVSLISALYLGAKSAKVTGYTDSGLVSGDTEQVVGYAGAVIY